MIYTALIWVFDLHITFLKIYFLIAILNILLFFAFYKIKNSDK